MSYADRIKPTDYHIRTYLEDLLHKNYQIPTFQREVVWDRDSVKKLWDSIFRFYPIGSILIWKTDLKLQNHRTVGGHVITNNDQADQFQYILDGQQRTTSLLTSLYGGEIEGRPGFDPTLYFDLTIEDQDEIDDSSFRDRFLFWDDIDDQKGKLTRNTPRMKRYQDGLIVKLRDVMQNFGEIEKQLVDGHKMGYDDPTRARLREVRDVLDNYRLSFVELKGIAVSEVCQIFERINQEGKPLDIFDIVVAKTFRLAKGSQPGFYLRELIEKFRKQTAGNFSEIGDLTYLQIIAVIINQNVPGSNILNITPVYLNRIKTEQIEAVWPDTEIAIRKMFDFFDNHLHLKGPRLIPYRYYYLTIASHLYKNKNPNYEFLKKYFWYYSFHYEDLLRNTTHLSHHINLLIAARDPSRSQLDRFVIDRHRLRTTAYSTKGRYANAILSLLANQEPRDWANPDRAVLTDVYYVLTDKPNLHHIFPTGYVSRNPGQNKLDSNSLMNIAYLTQLTNLKISDDNPIEYLQDYDGPKFEQVLQRHLVPTTLLNWARNGGMPADALDQFIETRIDLIIEDLREKLSGVRFDILDS
mgnify:CR=1 FL=1